MTFGSLLCVDLRDEFQCFGIVGLILVEICGKFERVCRDQEEPEGLGAQRRNRVEDSRSTAPAEQQEKRYRK